jgi:hypothetical protein
MVANAIIKLDQVQAIESVKVLSNIVTALRKDVFIEGQDYGTIPNTNDKPVLFLPGMEKLMYALKLRPEYNLLSSREDFDTPLFFYRYECRLVQFETELCIATAIGSANSHESKWRYRKAARICPSCQKEAICRSAEKYGGGWYCATKQGGCNAKFGKNDPAIINQPEGRIENEDIFDQVNTIDKIAQKRALGSAIKGAANVSQFFTVDIEDMVMHRITHNPSTGEIIEGEFEEVGQGKPPANVTPMPTTTPPVQKTPEPPKSNGTHPSGSTFIDALNQAIAAKLVKSKGEFETLLTKHGIDQALSAEDIISALNKALGIKAEPTEPEPPVDTTLDDHFGPKKDIQPEDKKARKEKVASKTMADRIKEGGWVDATLRSVEVKEYTNKANEPQLRLSFNAELRDGQVVKAGMFDTTLLKETKWLTEADMVKGKVIAFSDELPAMVKQDGKFWNVMEESIPRNPSAQFEDAFAQDEIVSNVDF